MKKLKESEFQFFNPILKSLNFYINDDFKEEDYNGLGDIISSVNTKRSDETQQALVTLSLKIGDRSKKVPFLIEISMEAKFLWDGFEDKQIDLLLNQNAPTLLISYMRPYISMITNGSEYPAYNLPFIDFRKE